MTISQKSSARITSSVATRKSAFSCENGSGGLIFFEAQAAVDQEAEVHHSGGVAVFGGELKVAAGFGMRDGDGDAVGDLALKERDYTSG